VTFFTLWPSPFFTLLQIKRGVKFWKSGIFISFPIQEKRLVNNPAPTESLQLLEEYGKWVI
jgi:hypothetical protein